MNELKDEAVKNIQNATKIEKKRERMYEKVKAVQRFVQKYENSKIHLTEVLEWKLTNREGVVEKYVECILEVKKIKVSLKRNNSKQKNNNKSILDEL